MRKAGGGSRTKKRSTMGIMPAILYGASVVGVSNAALTDMKRLVANTVGPRTQGRSLDMTLYLADIPIEQAANAAPLVKWHEAVWKGATRHGRARKDNLSLLRLKKLWMAANRRHRELRNWGDVAGPVGAIRLTARRMGWRIIHPFVWCDEVR